MDLLNNKRILLAVTAGIAAYKAAGIVRHFTQLGADVRVVMTKGAQEFITPLTLEVLSGHPVTTELFRPGAESEIGHIELARWGDAIVVAPATADLMAKARYGFADDLLTTILLATTSPVVLCPAMNTQMWFHTATQENLAALRARPGVSIVEPDSGELACKEVGPGRLVDPDVIEDELLRVLLPKPLQNLNVTVSAGPTREHFDPVRFLSNPSSGKMGFAIARAAYALGANVHLVSGPTELPIPGGVRGIRVTSAAEMLDAMTASDADITVMTAAVADWTPVDNAPHKQKKFDGKWAPELKRTADILQTLAASTKRPGTLIGFAAETKDVVDYARKKLEAKGIDGIVANNVAGADGAFGNDRNSVTLIDAAHSIEIRDRDKRALAFDICNWFADLHRNGQ